MKLFWKAIGIVLLVCLLGMRADIAFAGNPPDAAHSSLTATQVTANGTSDSFITVTLQDSGSTPLAGDTVSITSPSDGSAVISPAQATLDGSGQATFTMTSTNSGTHAITVRDETTGTDLVALGNVIFDAVVSQPSNNTGAPACGMPAPEGVPDLYQVTAGKTSDTIYFAPPNTFYDGFIVSYGLTASASDYTAQFTQPPTNGAIKYTVNSLIPKAIYYFKVRAVHGCANGSWSNVRSSQDVTGLTKLPATGPNNILLLGGFTGVLTLLAGIVLIVIF